MLLPSSFVCKVWLLVDYIKDVPLPPFYFDICSDLEHVIHAKVNAMKKREAFSKYKTAPAGSDARDDLRRAYLELAGIHKDWISVNESLNCF